MDVGPRQAKKPPITALWMMLPYPRVRMTLTDTTGLEGGFATVTALLGTNLESKGVRSEMR